MKQKIFFTSIISMLVVMPAMAKPSHTDEFPSTGLMQEDYTYTNAATFENTGVYDGSVDAIAEFEYRIGAGEYLPASADEIVDCPSGSYCPGIDGNVQYNQSSAQGIQTCPDGFASSEDGSSSDTQCYRACDVNNMGANGSISSIAHATAISGNDYYGNGTDTCEPTACENGYHVDSGSLDLTSLISASDRGIDRGYISNDGQDKENQSKYGITKKGEFVVDYGAKGKIHGHSQCSTQSGTNNNETWTDPTITSTLPNSSGKYCYCQLDGYTTSGGDTIAFSTPWVFRYFVSDNYGGAQGCGYYCTSYCSAKMYDTGSSNLAFRAAMFGSVTGVKSRPASCEANVININWSDASAADISANNAGTATYGSDVRTPVKATTKKGKTFRGWRFSKPEQTNLPE